MRAGRFSDVIAISSVVTMATNNEHARMRASHDCGQQANVDAIYSFWRQHFGVWSMSGVVAVAIEGNHVIGAAVGLPWSNEARDARLDGFRGELYALAVSPTYEGRSVGTRLVCFVAASLAKKDLLPMIVWTWGRSERAHRLYESRLEAVQLATRMERCLPGPARFLQIAFGWRDQQKLIQRCDKEVR